MEYLLASLLVITLDPALLVEDNLYWVVVGARPRRCLRTVGY
jgi:hypothetical protein